MWSTFERLLPMQAGDDTKKRTLQAQNLIAQQKPTSQLSNVFLKQSGLYTRPQPKTGRHLSGFFGGCVPLSSTGMSYISF